MNSYKRKIGKRKKKKKKKIKKMKKYLINIQKYTKKTF